MPVAKQRKSGVASGSTFTFISVAHPDETRERSTQRAIRSGAMAAIGRARRKRPEKPIVVELDMDINTVTHMDMLQTMMMVPPALPHLGIFAVEPDKRARELLHFSM